MEASRPDFRQEVPQFHFSLPSQGWASYPLSAGLIWPGSSPATPFPYLFFTKITYIRYTLTQIKEIMEGHQTLQDLCKHSVINFTVATNLTVIHEAFISSMIIPQNCLLYSRQLTNIQNPKSWNQYILYKLSKYVSKYKRRYYYIYWACINLHY